MLSYMSSSAHRLMGPMIVNLSWVGDLLLRGMVISHAGLRFVWKAYVAFENDNLGFSGTKYSFVLLVLDIPSA
jgi:hypothetical protein